MWNAHHHVHSSIPSPSRFKDLGERERRWKDGKNQKLWATPRKWRLLDTSGPTETVAAQTEPVRTPARWGPSNKREE